MTLAARLARLLRELTALPMRSRAARTLKTGLEHELMKLVTRAGLPAVDRAIAALNARDRRLALVGKHRAGRIWREELAPGRTLEISIVAGQIYRSTHVEYLTIRKPRLTPRQRTIHALQAAFYARYMDVGQKAYTDASYRLTAPDRLVLLVGELEADVNNGGFDQYLGNKGRRRARAALAALQTVGARKTAGMLETAMAPGTTPAQLSALDDRFYRVPEDLAVLTGRHVGLRPGREP